MYLKILFIEIYLCYAIFFYIILKKLNRTVKIKIGKEVVNNSSLEKFLNISICFCWIIMLPYLLYNTAKQKK